MSREVKGKIVFGEATEGCSNIVKFTCIQDDIECKNGGGTTISKLYEDVILECDANGFSVNVPYNISVSITDDDGNTTTTESSGFEGIPTSRFSGTTDVSKGITRNTGDDRKWSATTIDSNIVYITQKGHCSECDVGTTREYNMNAICTQMQTAYPIFTCNGSVATDHILGYFPNSANTNVNLQIEYTERTCDSTCNCVNDVGYENARFNLISGDTEEKVVYTFNDKNKTKIKQKGKSTNDTR
jgi:hypothetical protein